MASQQHYEDKDLETTGQDITHNTNQIQNPFTNQGTNNYDGGSDVSGIEFFDNLSTEKEKEPSMVQATSSQDEENLINQQQGITLDKVENCY